VTQSSNAASDARFDALVRPFCTRRGGLWVIAVLIAIGFFFGWQSALLDFGTIGLPGPGFFPLVLSVLLVGFAAVIGAELTRSKANGETVELGHRDVLIAIVALLVVPLLFESLGAYLTLGLFAAALLASIGRISVTRATLASVVGMVGVWYFFKVLLGLQLPNGPF
jgi:hypothetical protein